MTRSLAGQPLTIDQLADWNPIDGGGNDPLPPADLDAERQAIGCLLLDPAAMTHPEVAALSPDDYSDHAHRIIFAAMREVERAGTPAEPQARMAALVDHLRAAGQVEASGGAAYLSTLLRGVASAAYVRYHADVIIERARQREALQFATELAEEARAKLPATDLLGRIERFIEVVKSRETPIGGPKTVANIVKENKPLRRVIVDPIARACEVVNIVAPSKRGKSWLVLMFAICVALGRWWLGTFACTAGKVLIIDNELHEETSAYRLKAVSQAMGIDPESLNNLLIDNVRGRGLDINGLVNYLSRFKPGELSVVVLDALYRFYPKGFDENSNADMTWLYNVLDGIANRLQCVIVCIVHSSKGSQADKSVVDVGSGAGAMARAPDCHIAIREHEQPGCVVFEYTSRSFAPKPAICLRWAWPVWMLDSSLDPTALHRPGKRARDKQTETIWTGELFASRFGTTEPKLRAVIADDAAGAGITSRKAGELLNAAVARKKLYEWPTDDGRQVAYATVPPPAPSLVPNIPEKPAKKRRPKGKRS